MANLVLLALCFSAGWVARRSARFPAETPLVLNAWVMWLALPALIIGTIHEIPLQPRVLLAAGVLWVVFLVAAALALVAVRFGVDRKVAGALALTAGLGNTAFVGLPLIEAVAGRGAMALGIVVDQLGSFLVLSFVAVPFAAHMSGKHTSARALALRVLRFPPFVALIIALATRPLAYPDVAQHVLARLAETLSPIALLSVGWQLRLSTLGARRAQLAVGLSYKMIVAPLLAFGLLWMLGGELGQLERIAVLQAAMAPMVTAAVLASEHELDAELSALMLGVGVPLSFASIPLVWRLLAHAG